MQTRRHIADQGSPSSSTKTRGRPGSWCCPVTELETGLETAIRIPCTYTQPAPEPPEPTGNEETGVVQEEGAEEPEPTSHEPPSERELWTAAHQVQVPVARFPVDLKPTSVRALATSFGRDVIRLYNAVLTERRPEPPRHPRPQTPKPTRRILFYGSSAAQIADFVTAACAMVSPPMPPDALHQRMFAYASLADISFLEVRVWVRLRV